MHISNRIQNIQPSATMALSQAAKDLREKGKDVINLSIGQPDFHTPESIGKAAQTAIAAGKVDFYTPAAGLLALRKAIAAHLSAHTKATVSAKNVAVTNGAKFALYALAQALLDPGDQALIPLPYWVSYGEQVKLAGGEPVFVTPMTGMKVTVADLEVARTARTRLLILNSPNNPSGQVYTKEELTAIGEWAVANEVVIVADEIYGDLVYNGTAFTSLFDLAAPIREQTVVVNGLSKSYAMTGWRVGYLVAPEAVTRAVAAFLSHASSNIAAVSQYAALAALTGDQSSVEQMRYAYQERLAAVLPLINRLPGFETLQPTGAFYLFPRVAEAVAATGFATTTEFVTALLNEASVAVVPGAAFGMPDHVRISYATDQATLKEALRRIKDFVVAHQQASQAG